MGAIAGDPGALDSFRTVGTWLGYSGAIGQSYPVCVTVITLPVATTVAGARREDL
jgi:hypothetical protein